MKHLIVNTHFRNNDSSHDFVNMRGHIRFLRFHLFQVIHISKDFQHIEASARVRPKAILE